MRDKDYKIVMIQDQAVYLATFGSRFFAFLIDAAVLMGIEIGLRLVGASSTLIFVLVGLIYDVAFWTHDGATPGKKIVGIRVVEKDILGRRGVNVSTALIRSLGYYLSSLPFGLGFLWMLWDEKSQCWHDKLAGTYVIRDRRI